jgi:hypothetical protein
VRRISRSLAARLRAVRRMVRFGLLALAVLVPAHDLVYLAAHGARQPDALADTGHSAYWSAIAISALLAAAALAALSLHRSRSLRSRLASLGGLRVDRLPTRVLVGQTLRLWVVLLGVTLTVFAVQENIEHISDHAGHLPGLGVLYAAENAWVLPIFGALSLAAALVGTITLARLRALAVAVARAIAALRHRAKEIVRPPARMPCAARPLRSTPDLGRAPPQVLSA